MKDLINKIKNEKWPINIISIYEYCEKNNLLEELKEWQPLIIEILKQHNEIIKTNHKLGIKIN